MATDRAAELHVELAGLLAQHAPTLTEAERDHLVQLEEGYGWRPGRRPPRPASNIADFLDLFDRAEQEELTYRTLDVGTVEELRNAFRRGIATQ